MPNYLKIDDFDKNILIKIIGYDSITYNLSIELLLDYLKKTDFQENTRTILFKDVDSKYGIFVNGKDILEDEFKYYNGGIKSNNNYFILYNSIKLNDTIIGIYDL